MAEKYDISVNRGTIQKDYSIVEKKPKTLSKRLGGFTFNSVYVKPVYPCGLTIDELYQLDGKIAQFVEFGRAVMYLREIENKGAIITGDIDREIDILSTKEDIQFNNKKEILIEKLRSCQPIFNELVKKIKEIEKLKEELVVILEETIGTIPYIKSPFDLLVSAKAGFLFIKGFDYGYNFIDENQGYRICVDHDSIELPSFKEFEKILNGPKETKDRMEKIKFIKTANQEYQTTIQNHVSAQFNEKFNIITPNKYKMILEIHSIIEAN